MSRAGCARPPSEDEVDRACRDWADQWVRAFANGEGGLVGKPACTLAHVGHGRSNVASAQHWPEVFRGEALTVARARQQLLPHQRLFLFRHYVERWFTWNIGGEWERRRYPVRQRAMARVIGMSIEEYYRARDGVKRRVGAVL